MTDDVRTRRDAASDRPVVDQVGSGYPQPSSGAVSRVMRGNRKTDTKPEVRLRSALHRRGFRYRKHPVINAAGLRVRPDITFPVERLAVFVDGCFWHSCPIHGTSPKVNTSYWGSKLARNRERDALVVSALQAAGWTVVRIWEHVAIDAAVEEIAAAALRLRPARDPA